MGVDCSKPAHVDGLVISRSFATEESSSECELTHPGKMKILFLDVDGVLHPVNGHQEFVHSCVFELCRIVQATNASIVLSTAWRLVPAASAFLQAQMALWGLMPPIGETPELAKPPDNIFFRYCGMKGSMRPGEITAWLSSNLDMVDFPRWVAIDDIDMTAELDPHMVRTNKRIGLTPADADRAIWTLNSNELCDCRLCSSLACAQAV
mmetsp:Transcript_132492/g.247790  ORF Transcript_132492/g.247790 Transcript_132492/m.247790 type:complete len:208 (+) Transcript_132492:150-773(+)